MASKGIKGVHFQPWKGQYYFSGFRPGVRLLLLGESHYSEKKEASDLTVTLTQEYVDGDWKHRFWTNTMQAIEGRHYADIDRHDFWSRVAFYNFVQEIVAAKPGVGPTEQMLKRAEEPFYAVLDALKPTHILVLAKRLWENLPDGDGRGPDLALEKEVRESWKYFVGEGAYALATWVPHPSYGFDWARWHPWIACLLATR